jgi:hypothetical protein
VLCYSVGAVSIAEWGNQMVVYNLRSGDTHLLSDITKIYYTYILSCQYLTAAELIEFGVNYFKDIQEANVFVESIMQSLIEKDLVFQK